MIWEHVTNYRVCFHTQHTIELKKDIQMLFIPVFYQVTHNTTENTTQKWIQKWRKNSSKKKWNQISTNFLERVSSFLCGKIPYLICITRSIRFRGWTVDLNDKYLAYNQSTLYYVWPFSVAIYANYLIFIVIKFTIQNYNYVWTNTVD